MAAYLGMAGWSAGPHVMNKATIDRAMAQPIDRAIVGGTMAQPRGKFVVMSTAG